MIRAHTIVAKLDARSRAVLRRFVFLLSYFLFLTAIFGARHPLPMFLAMTSVAATVEIAMALIRREKISVSSLGSWDLAAAFIGLHCLARSLV